MRRGYILSLLMILITILAACEEEITEKIVREDSFSVEDISFKIEEGFFENSHVMFVDTEQETLVIDVKNTTFIKSNEPKTTIDVKWLSDETELISDWLEATIFLSEDDIPEISKAYAKKYFETISLE